MKVTKKTKLNDTTQVKLEEVVIANERYTVDLVLDENQELLSVCIEDDIPLYKDDFKDINPTLLLEMLKIAKLTIQQE